MDIVIYQKLKLVTERCVRPVRCFWFNKLKMRQKLFAELERAFAESKASIGDDDAAMRNAEAWLGSSVAASVRFQASVNWFERAIATILPDPAGLRLGTMNPWQILMQAMEICLKFMIIYVIMGASAIAILVFANGNARPGNAVWQLFIVTVVSGMWASFFFFSLCPLLHGFWHSLYGPRRNLLRLAQLTIASASLGASPVVVASLLEFFLTGQPILYYPVAITFALGLPYFMLYFVRQFRIQTGSRSAALRRTLVEEITAALILWLGWMLAILSVSGDYIDCTELSIGIFILALILIIMRFFFILSSAGQNFQLHIEWEALNL